MIEEIRKSRNSLSSSGSQRERLVEFLVAHEMAAVGIGAHLCDQLVPFLAHGADVGAVEFREIGGVEARAQHRVFVREAGRFGGLDLADGRVHRNLRSVKLTS